MIILIVIQLYRICPIGEKALNLCSKQEDYLLEVLDKGAKNAREVSNQTIVELKQRAGILRK
jgi:hypothetical protein